MADKYTIQINPQLSQSEAQKMEQDLNRRFSNVSKKFGKNLGNSLKTAAKVGIGALAAGIALTLATNPFEKINTDLNQTLDKFDNSAQKAEQFGVDSAKYFRAERIAGSFGVEDFETIINRFSGSLEAARTKKDTTLENFVGDKDVIDSFNAFTQSLALMKADDRNAALDRVFGGRMGLRVGDLAAQDTDSIVERNRRIFGNMTNEDIARNLKKMNELKDIQDVNMQKLAVEELRLKSNAISTGTMQAQDRKLRADLSRQTTQLSQYQIWANLATQQERMAQSIDTIKADFAELLLPAVQKIVDFLPTAVDWMRSAIDWFGRIVAAIKKWNPFKR